MNILIIFKKNKKGDARMINTIKGLKDYLQVGQEIKFKGHGVIEDRIIKIKQSKKVAFKVKGGDNNLKWLDIPQKKDITFQEDYFSIISLFGDELQYHYK